MSLVLVDASAWSLYLHSGKGALCDTLETLLSDNRAALCGPTLTEARQGLGPREEKDVLDLFETLPFIDTSREDYDRAGALLADLAQQGITLPVTNGLIAQLALHHELPLLENDARYSKIEALRRVPWREDSSLEPQG
jgi:predicted nucleic acid-binding protein